MRSHRFQTILGCIVVGLLPAGVRAQGGGGLSGSDSRVGYIDNAIPATEFRLRFDNSSNDHRPTRAEFLYPKGKPNGPGLPEPQRSVDFQALGWSDANAGARLFVVLVAEVALIELETGRNEAMRQALWSFARIEPV